ncbi:hypothetical protein LX32DRAFT_45775 [Colletotrichum zoysiae]|uniref:Uncharacterized protein n=1 Tax=Colletotrichum zoysiae TaxID=1216348 RepID=A0AAD9HBJ5_9PEZI|nr:hypothetical protein LX32DRAFT_45775 [Colletotrichum zoysiae]
MCYFYLFIIFIIFSYCRFVQVKLPPTPPPQQNTGKKNLVLPAPERQAHIQATASNKPSYDYTRRRPEEEEEDEEEETQSPQYLHCYDICTSYLCSTSTTYLPIAYHTVRTCSMLTPIPYPYPEIPPCRQG